MDTVVRLLRSEDLTTVEPWRSNNLGAGLVEICPGFGYPRLRSGGDGRAQWTPMNNLSQWQKGTGWQANLYGGDQTGGTPFSAGANWGAIFIPVREMTLPDLKTAKWTYLMTNAEVYGVNIVIWAHDPDDLDKRVEITQSGSATSLAKASGWNAHEFPSGAAEFFWYGENTTGLPDICTTAGTLYRWDQFQQDAEFKTWTIYRISLEYGWYTTGTFEDAWVADLKINNFYIPLQPSPEELLQRHPLFAVDTDGESAETDVLTLAPNAPFRLLALRVHLSKAVASGETLTISIDDINGSTYDAVLYKRDLSLDSVTDLDIPFDDDLKTGDIILAALSANSGSAVWGCVGTYEYIIK